MNIKVIITALAALWLAAPAFALTISPDEYFAYFHFRQMNQYTLLSHAPCADKASAKKGWKKAATTTAIPDELRNLCWTNGKNEDVFLCAVSGDRQLGDDCFFVGKARFLETASLPRRPKF